MRTTSFMCMALALSVWLAGDVPVFSQSPADRGHLIVTSATANVMSGSNVVGQVRSGQRLPFTMTNGDWYLVEFQQDGQPSRGWIRGVDVRLETAPSVPGAEPVALEGWGTLVDPAGGATAVEKNGALELSVPGVYRDLWPSGKVNSPRIVQTVKGDFLVQVKIASPVDVAGLSLTRDRPPDVRSIYRAGCLVIWQDENSFYRLERASSHTTDHFWYYKAYLDGEVQFAKHGLARPDEASYLRVQRKQGTLYAWYRQEGDTDWTMMEPRRLNLSEEVQVGVSLINTTSEPFTVKFENFQVD